MSASEGATKFPEKESSVNLIKKKSKMYIQPHFAEHTESSLRKRKIPIKSNKKISTLEMTKSKKLQENLVSSRLNGISKKQSKIMKQSMQALKTVLKQEKQRRSSDFLQDNKLMGTVYKSKQYMENLLVSLQRDLIKYTSLDLKKCIESPVKLQTLQDEISSTRSLSVYPENSKSISDCSEDSTIVNLTCKLQLQLNDNEENFANYCKIEVPHRRSSLKKLTEKLIESIKLTESAELTDPTDSRDSKDSTDPTDPTDPIDPTDSIDPTEPTELTEPTEPTEPTELTKSTKFTESTKDCSKIEEQIFEPNISMNLNAAINCRFTQETLINEKIEVQSEPNLQLARNTKFIKHIDYSRNKDIRPVINSNVVFDKKKGVLQRNSSFIKAQRTWRSPDTMNSSHIESMYMISLTQPMLQKSSQSTKKYIPPTKHKYAKLFDSKLSTYTTHQSKQMKENRDPCVNQMTKICDSLIELKQQQRLQSTEEMLRRKKSTNQVGSKISKKYNDHNPEKSRLESKSRCWQTRLITPTRSLKIRNDIEQHHPDFSQISERPKSSKVIHALKDIKNTKHKYANKDAVSISKDDMLNYEGTEFPTLFDKKPFSKMTQKHNLRFTKNKNLNEANQSVNKSHKSVSTQTKLNSFLHHKIDPKNRLDSKQIFKSTQTVTTQTSPCRDESVKCNTTVCNVTCKNVGVFCNLIDSMNIKVKIDSTAIQNKSISEDIETNESLSTESVEINVENKYPKDNEKTLTTEMSLKLENYVSIESDAQCEDMIVPELEENISSQVIAAFELTAERVRNLYKAVIIYQNLMSREFGRRQEEYALKVWDGSFETNRRVKALALPMATEKIISRENYFTQFPFIHYVLCILLFCFQFLFNSFYSNSAI